MHRYHLYLLAAAAFWMLLALTAMSLAQPAAAGELFSPIDPVEGAARIAPGQSQLQGVIRTRYATLNAGTLARADTGPLTLNLFEDAHFVLKGQHIIPHAASSPAYTLSGSAGMLNTHIILTVGQGFIVGRIMTPNGSYYIEPVGDSGLHAISQIDLSMGHNAAIPSDTLDPQAGPQGITPPAVLRAPAQRDSGAIIDLLVVYTPAAQGILGGSTATTEAAIHNMVALTNTTYINSSIKHRIRLVHIAPVDYVEQPADYSYDLQNLTFVDGYMDEVHSLRDQYGADLVMLITGTLEPQRNYCGLAWLSYQQASRGFSVSEAVCAGTVVMPHELGHNMGANHDPANAGGSIFPFAYGYQDPRTGPDDWGDFVTVMAYGRNGHCPLNNPISDVNQGEICPHIPYWSNPKGRYNDKPLGTAQANNRRTLNRTAQSVANYRQDVGELLINGSFEAGLDGWQAFGFSAKDRVLRDNTNRRVSHVGHRALRLKGEPGERSRLRQDIDPGALQSGDILTLSAWGRGKNLSNGVVVRLRVDYADPALPRDVLRLRFDSGSYAYTPLHGSLTLAGTPERVRVFVSYTNQQATGAAFIDGVSLSRAANGIETDWQPDSPLPLPAPAQ
jgi:peptidyl-Asp metalloendopeptidase